GADLHRCRASVDDRRCRHRHRGGITAPGLCSHHLRRPRHERSLVRRDWAHVTDRPAAEFRPAQVAHVAWAVLEAAVTQYRSPFSKHTFTRPSLLAILCLKQYEDGTVREAELRLGEALRCGRVPNDTARYRSLCRTTGDDVTPLLHATMRRLPPPPEEGTALAVDGTGLAPGAISTFFVNRAGDRGEGSPGGAGSRGW